MSTLVLAVTFAVTLIGSPQPARATVKLVACTTGGPWTATLTPGLHTTPAAFTWTVTGDLTGCLSTDLTISPFKVQHYVGSGTGFGSCTNVTITGAGTVTWNNGETTSVSGSGTFGFVAGVPVANGSATATSGEFAGSSATGLGGFTPPVLCATPGGMTSNSGAATLVSFV